MYRDIRKMDRILKLISLIVAAGVWSIISPLSIGFMTVIAVLFFGLSEVGDIQLGIYEHF